MKQTREGQLATCRCNHCGGDVEFKLIDAGTEIACRHCGQKTVLTVPPAHKMAAKEITTNSDSKGIESVLDNCAIAVLIAAIVGGVILLWMGLFKSTENYLLAGIGVAGGIGGTIVACLFYALAEVVRLLKKSCGLKYSGTISQPNTKQSYTCGRCHARVGPRATKCAMCDAEFV